MGKPKISPLMARLIEEIRLEGINGPALYSRMHNRHNRSIIRRPPPPPPTEPESKT